uniref:Uncharacterized protein n=1 Tax=Anopheles melas TaxID=34690 RepID=A0A182UDC2_9DIPT
MNAGLSKIHFVNTTGVSLNDRFTTMTKATVGFGAAPAMVEAPRPRANSVTRATESNRRLVDQWDQLHALQALGVKVRVWFTHITWGWCIRRLIFYVLLVSFTLGCPCYSSRSPAAAAQQLICSTCETDH